MTSLARKVTVPTEDEALAFVASGAAEADAGRRTLAEDMAMLAASGILNRLCRGDPSAHATLLRRIGRVSLPVGRLAEGHMNALKLVALHGTARQRQSCQAEADSGTIFGVWGADDDPPLRIAEGGDGALRLSGGKRFASGLGTVGRAVLTAESADGPQLLLATVTDRARADAAVWKTSGMRATVSGRYDFNGATAEPLGAPGDYLKEPHFQGGVWRYAALQTGGIEALAEEVRRAVATRGDAATEAQLHRVARIVALAHGARLCVEDAARQVEGPGAGPGAVALSLAAREAVEQASLDAIAIADRALGTRSFATGHRADLVRRDLAFFLRQADLDGKLTQVGRTLCRADLPVGEFWGVA
ncbi:hypothetical protein [Oceaniglobus roseus]|uniref:hypothetical protein n=1 Tax=Oceaniglobus roseus TaxID=1737570 RepID=UPI000C7F1681|nr:hypothetical protein [Kandeliimicrobium roseum]